MTSATFSPDGKHIVTTSWDTARVWDAASGAVVVRLEGHSGWVVSAAFSPDGARIVTASEDNSSRVWNVSRTAAIAGNHAVSLAAALACGIGRRTVAEAKDLLLQDAPEDLFGKS